MEDSSFWESVVFVLDLMLVILWGNIFFMMYRDKKGK